MVLSISWSLSIYSRPRERGQSRTFHVKHLLVGSSCVCCRPKPFMWLAMIPTVESIKYTTRKKLNVLHSPLTPPPTPHSEGDYLHRTGFHLGGPKSWRRAEASSLSDPRVETWETSPLPDGCVFSKPLFMGKPCNLSSVNALNIYCLA